MTPRGEDLKPGNVQIVPRGRWKACSYRDKGDGTAFVLIGPNVYVVPIERVKARKLPRCC